LTATRRTAATAERPEHRRAAAGRATQFRHLRHAIGNHLPLLVVRHLETFAQRRQQARLHVLRRHVPAIPARAAFASLGARLGGRSVPAASTLGIRAGLGVLREE
jgi:hypothetical protein